MSQGGTSGRESKKKVEENKETVIRNKKEVANRTDRNVDNQTSQHKKHETNLTENTQTTSTNQDAEVLYIQWMLTCDFSSSTIFPVLSQ